MKHLKETTKQRVYWHWRRYKVLSHYSDDEPKCSCCGETYLEFLAIDHENGNGAEHRKQICTAHPSKADIVVWIIRNGFPAGFRVLCHNCNLARGLYGFCPHEVGEQLGALVRDYRVGLPIRRRPAIYSRLKSEDIPTIRQRLRNGERRKPIAADYNVSVSTIDHIKAGRTWKGIQ